MIAETIDDAISVAIAGEPPATSRPCKSRIGLAAA
jgi:hypothetical protein